MFRFVTTRFVLLKEPQSVLAKMFEIDSTMEPAAKLKDGSYFIDRDPERFKQILNYLRDDELADLTRAELNNLKIDARYFMLENLLGIINERLDNSQNFLEGKIDKITSTTLDSQRSLEGKIDKITSSILDSQRSLEGKIDKVTSSILDSQRSLEKILKNSIVEKLDKIIYSIEESQRNLVKEIKRANFFEDTDLFSIDGLERESFVREMENLSEISKSVEKSYDILTEIKRSIDSSESVLRQILKK